MPDKIPLIIDCDPGIDDAVALLLAFASPELELLAITTVAGNINATLTARNARIVRELADRWDVPVFSGATQPIARKAVEASEIHGESGLGDLEIFEPKAPHEQKHSVDAIIDLIQERPAGSVTIALTGPMTNFALALQREPSIAGKVRRLVVMAGARPRPEGEGGNITPHAEFNVFADPEAAAIVFAAGIETVVFGLDVTHQVRATESRTATIRALHSPAALAVAGLFEFANKVELLVAGGDGTPLHDPCTVAWLLRPELFTLRPCRVAVETASPVTLGMTIVDFDSTPSEMNCLWATRADADGVFALLNERLAR